MLSLLPSLFCLPPLLSPSTYSSSFLPRLLSPFHPLSLSPGGSDAEGDSITGSEAEEDNLDSEVDVRADPNDEKLETDDSMTEVSDENKLIAEIVCSYDEFFFMFVEVKHVLVVRIHFVCVCCRRRMMRYGRRIKQALLVLSLLHWRRRAWSTLMSAEK